MNVITFQQLELVPKFESREQWRAFGSRLKVADRLLNWAKGDWLNSPEGDIEEGIKILDISTPQIGYNLAAVSKAFETSLRNEKLTWSHHRFSMAADDRKERIAWLDKAERNGWSAQELRRQIISTIQTQPDDERGSKVGFIPMKWGLELQRWLGHEPDFPEWDGNHLTEFVYRMQAHVIKPYER